MLPQGVKESWDTYRKERGINAPIFVLAQYNPTSHATWDLTWEESHGKWSLILDTYYVSTTEAEDENGEKKCPSVVGQVVDLYASGLPLIQVELAVNSLKRFTKRELDWPEDDSDLSRKTIWSLESRGHTKEDMHRRREAVRAVLSVSPRLTCPGFDLDMNEAAMAMGTLKALDAEVHKDGFQLIWQTSGDPSKPHFHGEFSCVEPGAETPHLNRSMLGYYRDVCRRVGLVSNNAGDKFYIAGDEATNEKGELVRGGRYGCVDLTPSNRGAENRGSQFRGQGGLSKDSLHRKTKLSWSPDHGSLITRELVARGAELYNTQQAAKGRSGIGSECPKERVRRVLSPKQHEMDATLKESSIPVKSWASVVAAIKLHLPADKDTRQDFALCLPRILMSLQIAPGRVISILLGSFGASRSGQFHGDVQDLAREARGLKATRKMPGKRSLAELPGGLNLLIEIARAYCQDVRNGGMSPNTSAVVTRLLSLAQPNGLAPSQRMAEAYLNSTCRDTAHRYHKMLKAMLVCGTHTGKECETHGETPQTLACKRIACMWCRRWQNLREALLLEELWRPLMDEVLFVESPEFKTREALRAWERLHVSMIGWRWVHFARGPERWVAYWLKGFGKKCVPSLGNYTAQEWLDVAQERLVPPGAKTKILKVEDAIEDIMFARLGTSVVSASLFLTGKWAEWETFTDQCHKKHLTGVPKKFQDKPLPWPNAHAKLRAEEFQHEDNEDRCGADCLENGLAQYVVKEPVTGSITRKSKHPPTTGNVIRSFEVHGILLPEQRLRKRLLMQAEKFKVPAVVGVDPAPS